MEAFHELKVNCPYEILEIEDIRISNKPNEHGSLYLRVLVDEDVKFKYAIEASTDDKICIYEETENKDKTIIFNGTIQNIKTSNVNRLYYMEIEALTSSFSFDIQEKSRSFQDIEMSYDELINTILRDYKIYSFTQCMNRPTSIGRPLFQYKETDYEFLKRISSHLGLQLICDIINPNNVFYFGMPNGKMYEIEEDIDYTACKDLKRYREACGYTSDFHDTDFFYYEIKTKEVMEIGAKVIFKQKEFYINSYEAEYIRGELIFTYKLCRKKGIWQQKLYNDKIKGISLEGKVIEVSGEQVKLYLDIDESQNKSKAAWFRYAPPTGNIMYSMPIVGTNANLYFSSERTEDPIVIGCVRKNGSSYEKFSNVNNRYFATESDNNLDMLPDAINLSRPGLSANFNDGSGITLSSSSSLSITAGYVGMFAGNVSITGTTKLVAEKGESSFISLENDFYNDAGIVKENGSDRSSNEKFTDDEPTNGVVKAKAAMEMQLNDSALVAANEGSIPLSGEALEERTDIPEFNKNQQYPDGTLVKKQMDDGTYVLGKATSPNNKNISVFEALDKEAVAQHTSLKDELKSYGYGILGGGYRFSSEFKQFLNHIGETCLGSDYRPGGEGGKTVREIIEDDEAADQASYNELREKAPCKSQFDDASNVTDISLNIIAIYDGIKSISSAVKSVKGFVKGVYNYFKGSRGYATLDADNFGREVAEIANSEKNIKITESSEGDLKGLKEIEQEVGVKITNKSSSEIPNEGKTASEGVGKTGETRGPTSQKIVNNSSRGGGCFTGDTLIFTQFGHKPMKDIKVGDEVYCKNIQSGEYGLKSVRRVFINKSLYIVHIKVNSREIKCTLDHPFWIINKGWMPAKDIKIGYEIETYCGNVEYVSEIIIDKLSESIEVYNIETDELNTYYVSNLNLLVHNGCDASEQELSIEPPDTNYSNVGENSNYESTVNKNSAVVDKVKTPVTPEEIESVLDSLPEGTPKDVSWTDFEKITTGSGSNSAKAEAYYQYTGKEKPVKNNDSTTLTAKDKGKIGEKVADRQMKECGAIKFPSKVGPDNGFDGVYVLTKDGMKIRNADGSINIDAIQEIIINESKYNTAQLGNAKCGTKDGQYSQLSDEWIEFNIERMKNDSDLHVQETADMINQYLERGNGISVGINRITLLEDGGANNVWTDYKRYSRFKEG